MFYVPLIILQDRRCTPAKYIWVVMSDNLEAFGTMAQGEQIFHAEIHTVRSHDYGKAAEYTPDNLKYLCTDYAKLCIIDNALAHIRNVLLTVEVCHYCAATEICDQLENQIHALKDNHYHNVEWRRQLAQWLSHAHTIKHIREEHKGNTRLVAVPVEIPSGSTT